MFRALTPFGLEHHSENGRRIIGHDGSIAGFDALMQTYVDKGLTIIVLTNTNGAAHPLEAKIVKILMPCPPLMSDKDGKLP
jgi:hypothetical protein